MSNISRIDAWKLLNEYTKDPSLISHALSVEAAMREYALHFNEDEDYWGITGLIHDFDYEKFPTAEEHPYKGNEILRNLGYPKDILDAVMGHAEYTGVKRETLMAKTLYAVDELAGFIIAVALVRPSKSIHDVKPKSVKKKFKAKAFAKAVSREDIKQGIAELGIDETEHIQKVIDALQKIAPELGLEGNVEK